MGYFISEQADGEGSVSIGARHADPRNWGSPTESADPLRGRATAVS